MERPAGKSRETCTGSQEKEKGSDKADKSKQTVGNRLYQPTAAWAAKRKPVGGPSVKAPNKPAFNQGTAFRRSIKRPTAGDDSAQNKKGQSSKVSQASKSNAAGKRPEKGALKSSPSSDTANVSGDSQGNTSTKSNEAEKVSAANEMKKDDSTVKATAEAIPERLGSDVESEGRSRQTRPLQKPASEEKRDQTPEMSVLSTDRGASTPTGEGHTSETILDSWDASQIVGVNKTRLPNLNDTQSEPCVSLKEKFTMPKPVFGKPAATTRVAGKKSLTVQKGRKSMMPGSSSKGVPATVCKTNQLLNLTTVQEPEDPDAISDELVEQAHCRYIQALYLQHISKQVRDKTVKECEEKLVASWKLLEQERQEVIQLEQELARVSLVADIQAILNAMEPYIGDGGGGSGEKTSLFDQVLATSNNLDVLSNSLDHVKHNIEIKGISIEKDKREHTAQQLVKRIQNFTRSIKSGELVCPEMKDSIQMLERFKECAKCMLNNFQECHKLIEQCRRLTTKEVSLRLSLNMVEQAGNRSPDKAAKDIRVEDLEADNLEEENIDVKADLRKSFDGLSEQDPAQSQPGHLKSFSEDIVTQTLCKETPAAVE